MHRTALSAAEVTAADVLPQAMTMGDAVPKAVTHLDVLA
jgi:hypothetical protein